MRQQEYLTWVIKDQAEKVAEVFSIQIRGFVHLFAQKRSYIAFKDIFVRKLDDQKRVRCLIRAELWLLSTLKD